MTPQKNRSLPPKTYRSKFYSTNTSSRHRLTSRNGSTRQLPQLNRSTIGATSSRVVSEYWHNRKIQSTNNSFYSDSRKSKWSRALSKKKLSPVDPQQLEEINKLESWHSNLLQIQQSRKFSSKGKNATAIDMIPHLDQLDNGRKMITLMDSILEENSKLFKEKGSQNYQSARVSPSNRQLKNTSKGAKTGGVFIQSQEKNTTKSAINNKGSNPGSQRQNNSLADDKILNNKLLLEQILKRKLKMRKIKVHQKMPNRKELGHELKSIALDVVSRFKVLSSYYRHNLELQKHCKAIVDQMMLDSQKNEHLNLQSLNEQQKEMARLSFFDKLKKVQTELDFCEKKIEEKNGELSQLQSRLQSFYHHRATKKESLKRMADLQSFLHHLPKKRSLMILKGFNTQGKHIKSLDKEMREKQEQLDILTAQFKHKEKKAQVEEQALQDYILRCASGIKYLEHAKESYKIDLIHYFKDLFGGDLPLDYYSTSLIEYLVYMNKMGFQVSDVNFWDGLDQFDLEFIIKSATLSFQLYKIKKKSYKSKKAVGPQFEGDQCEDFKGPSKRCLSHFQMVNRLDLPSTKELIQKMYRKKNQRRSLESMNMSGLPSRSRMGDLSPYRHKNVDFMMKDFEEGVEINHRANNYNFDALSEAEGNKGNTEVKPPKSSDQETIKITLNASKNVQRVLLPSMEIKDELEKREKEQIKKLKVEFTRIKYLTPKFEKKMAIIYGLEPSKKLLLTFQASKYRQQSIQEQYIAFYRVIFAPVKEFNISLPPSQFIQYFYNSLKGLPSHQYNCLVLFFIKIDRQNQRYLLPLFIQNSSHQITLVINQRNYKLLQIIILQNKTFFIEFPPMVNPYKGQKERCGPFITHQYLSNILLHST